MFVRKLGEIASDLYRALIFPFVRIAIELKTGSVMKQRTYVNKGTVLHGKNYIGKGSTLTNVDFGYGSYVSAGSDIANCKVGKYCSLGPNIVSVGGSHPVREFISIHPAFYAKSSELSLGYIKEDKFNENKFTDEARGYFYEIGNDVWIGANVCISQGVHIGDGAVVGACSLVLTDIEPYAIYAGVPAKKIGQRFDDETVNKLLQMKWWDKDEAWIKQHADEFENVKTFIEKNS